jgi:hypothetical protein
MDEAAKAAVADRLAKANPGDVVDGTKLGYEAAQSALAAYVVAGDVSEPIEVEVSAAGELAVPRL